MYSFSNGSAYSLVLAPADTYTSTYFIIAGKTRAIGFLACDVQLWQLHSRPSSWNHAWDQVYALAGPFLLQKHPQRKLQMISMFWANRNYCYYTVRQLSLLKNNAEFKSNIFQIFILLSIPHLEHIWPSPWLLQANTFHLSQIFHSCLYHTTLSQIGEHEGTVSTDALVHTLVLVSQRVTLHMLYCTQAPSGLHQVVSLVKQHGCSLRLWYTGIWV